MWVNVSVVAVCVCAGRCNESGLHPCAVRFHYGGSEGQLTRGAVWGYRRKTGVTAAVMVVVDQPTLRPHRLTLGLCNLPVSTGSPACSNPIARRVLPHTHTHTYIRVTASLHTRYMNVEQMNFITHYAP